MELTQALHAMVLVLAIGPVLMVALAAALTAVLMGR